jgi:hypothetical protein
MRQSRSTEDSNACEIIPNSSSGSFTKQKFEQIVKFAVQNQITEITNHKRYLFYDITYHDVHISQVNKPCLVNTWTHEHHARIRSSETLILDRR